MTDIYEKLLRTNVELEGALRVLRERESAEALEVAENKFNELSSLFSNIKSGTDTTVAKEDEAEGAEEAPLTEPSESDVPDNTVVAESDSESIAAAVEEAALQAKKSEEDPIMPTAANIVTPSKIGDIRKAMTLNDKFLFKRELFGGNEAELNDTIELLASMHSFDEAEEYIYDDLQWDRKNPTVADFMSIVKSYFSDAPKA